MNGRAREKLEAGRGVVEGRRCVCVWRGGGREGSVRREREREG